MVGSGEEGEDVVEGGEGNSIKYSGPEFINPGLGGMAGAKMREGEIGSSGMSV